MNIFYLLKSSLFSLSTTLLIKVLNFVSLYFVIRLFNIEQFGYYNYLLSITPFLILILPLNLTSSIVIYRSNNQLETLNQFTYVILVGSSIILILLALFFLVFSNLPLIFSFLLVLDTFAINSFSIHKITQLLKEKHVEFVKIEIFLAILSFLFGLVFIFIFNDKVFGKILGTLIPYLVFAIIRIFKNFTNVNFGTFIKYLSFGLTISIPLIFHSLSNVTLLNIDKIMITNLYGVSTNSKYSFSVTVVSILSVILFSINSSWSPWFVSNLREGNLKRVYNATNIYIFLFMASFLAFGYFLPELYISIGTKSYYDSIITSPQLLLGVLFQFFYLFFINIEFFHSKVKLIPIGSIIAVMINIILNYYLLPLYGYEVAALTTSISYFILCFFHFIIAYKISNLKFYNLLNMLINLVISILFISFLNKLFLYSFITRLFVFFISFLFYTFFYYLLYKFSFLEFRP